LSGLEVETKDRLRHIDLDVEFEVESGSCMAIVGPSGAGKSTVLRIIAGLRRPDPGRVAVNGLTWLDTHRGVDLLPEERACGFMFQEYALFPHMSVWRNVAFGISGPTGERRGRSLALLERFGVDDLADARPGSISGGERQRVALARALARDPRVLLLDEPLSSLDTRTRARAGRELSSALRATGVPTVVVTHDFTEATLLADEICVMDRGRIVQRGSGSMLAANPASPFVAELAGSVVLTGMARPEPPALTLVELEGGGVVHSPDAASGPVAARVFPWEISLEPPDAETHGSALNRLTVEVVSVSEVGNRVRVGLASPQPLVAEITSESRRALGLEPGVGVTAVWKATATRLLPR
jgi:molybdate transport system ATP-binding protein